MHPFIDGFRCFFRPALTAAGLALLLPLHATGTDKSPTIIEGKVIAVLDGDTVDVLVGHQKHRLRFLAIDAPEKSQAFGQRSKQNLSDLTFKKHVVAYCGRFDTRRNRYECKVTAGGRDINLAQVQSGFAWHWKDYQRFQEPEDRSKYAAAHENAKSHHVGLWSDPSPVPPWKFRREAARGEAQESREPFADVTGAADLVRRVVHALAYK